jgi:hypothetical protein
MNKSQAGKLAVLWRGDRHARSEATAENNRLNRVFEALAAIGIQAEPAVYADDTSDEVREQLLNCDGVLVWVDPISEGQNRMVLDALLRDVASRGVWVSTQPDVILKMGVKEAHPPPSEVLKVRPHKPRSQDRGSCARVSGTEDKDGT